MKIPAFLLFMLGLCFTSHSLRAQLPSAISVGAFQSVRQTSATAQRFNGTGFVGDVSFRVEPPPDTVVQLITPTGASYTLTRQSFTTFSVRVSYPDAAQLASGFPSGVYTVAVSEGSEPTSTSFPATFGVLPSPVLITNFDALQAWPTPYPEPAWQPVAGASGNDQFEMIFRQGSKVLTDSSFNAADSGGPTTSFSNASITVPSSALVQCGLEYYRLANTAANSLATRIAIATGFEVLFTLRHVPLAPTIVQQPSSRVAQIGSTASFQVTATGIGERAFRYQLKKDGIPVLGASSRGEFSFPVSQLSDAGAYTIDVSYGDAMTTSAPAFLVIPPALTFTTFAGSGVAGGKDGVGTAAEFDEPTALAVDRAGKLYVADYNAATIRTISPDGVVRTLAGLAGQTGSADGIGSAARFDGPIALTVDSAGNVYVADYRNGTIRKITPEGVVSTFAGTAGQLGMKDGLGASARFNRPSGLAADPAGNLYVSDLNNYAIRKITPDGSVSTLAGQSPFSGRVDGTGAAARFVSPGLCKFVDGALYVCDGPVRRVTPAGVVTTLNGLSVDTGDGNGIPVSDSGARDIAVDSSGAIYEISNGIRRRVIGGVALTMGKVPAAALVIDATGTIIIADPNNHVIRKGTFLAGSTDTHLDLLAGPRSQSMPVGANVALSVTASGPGVSYQWQKNGAGLVGATNAVLYLPKVTLEDQGTYAVLVGNSIGLVSPQSAPVQLSVLPGAVASRLNNLSFRSTTNSEDQPLIAGLVVGGGSPGTTAPFLIRGIGPGLTPFGVSDALADPILTVTNNQGGVIVSNDNWSGTTALAETFTATGAFGLSATSRDAALVASLSNNAYSIRVAGKNDSAGTALVEVYDATRGTSAATAPHLVNLSARAQVEAGENAIIAGFVVNGATGKTLLIRGVGPSLERYGVSAFLFNPLLRVFDSAGTLVASNDNWFDGTNPMSVIIGGFSDQVGAFPLTSGRDAALVATVPPGAYTVEVSDAGHTAGVGLIEIYEIP